MSTPLERSADEAADATPWQLSAGGRARVGRVAESLFGDSPATTRLGRYELREKLGSGGFGAVYRAYDPSLERDVALKVVHAELDGPIHHARLFREARALASLDHPNVVPVYDVGTQHGEVFVAMELLRGQSLRAWLQRDAPAQAEVLRVFLEAAAGLAAVHDAGLVHRDFKPDNVMLTDDGRIQLIDFGLARGPDRLHDRTTDGAAGSVAPGLEALTVTGETPGTPGYMAPELWNDPAATAASDQFAFCVSLYEALEGGRPIDALNRREYVARTRTGEAELAQPRNVPDRLWAIVQRGLKTNPARRFESMAALTAAIHGERRARRRRLAVFLGGLALAGLGGLWAFPVEATKCDGAASGMFGSWNDASKSDIERQFEQLGGETGRDTSRRVLERGNAFVKEWEDFVRETCNAAQAEELSDAEVDRALACARRHADSFEQRLELWRHADASIAVRAISMAASLGAPSDCRSGAATHGQPNRHREGLRRRIDRADVLLRAGKATEAQIELDALLEPVRSASDPWLEALWSGVSAAAAGEDAVRAAQLSGRAVTLALRAGDFELAARQAIWWCSDVTQLGRADTMTICDRAVTLADHRSVSAATRLRAELARARAVLDDQGPAAAGEAIEAIYMRARALGDLELQGSAASARARLQALRGEGSLAMLEETAQLTEMTDGPVSPLTVSAKLDVVIERISSGDLDRARAQLKQIEASLPEGLRRTETWRYEAVFAILEWVSGDLEAAAARIDAALWSVDSPSIPAQYRIAVRRHAYRIHRDLGDDTRADALMEEARSLVDDHGTALLTPQRAVIWFDVAARAEQRGQLQEASRYFQRCIRELADFDGAAPELVAGAAARQAHVLIKLGRSDEARPLLAEAEKTLSARESPPSPETHDVAIRALVAAFEAIGEHEHAERLRQGQEP